MGIVQQWNRIVDHWKNYGGTEEQLNRGTVMVEQWKRDGGTVKQWNRYGGTEEQ